MKGGMGNGLELMLDIQQDEYLPVWGETGKKKLTKKKTHKSLCWFGLFFLNDQPPLLISLLCLREIHFSPQFQFSA